MTIHPLFGSPDVLEVRVPVTTMWSRPDAPRGVDAGAVADVPDVASWTASMDAGVRKGLDGRTLTQLLMGEAVQVIEEHDGWARVRALLQPSSADRDGYPGWVRRSHLAAPVPRTDGAVAFVVAPVTKLSVEGGADSAVSFGTALWVEEVTDAVAQVLLPGDRSGTVPLPDVRLSHKRERLTLNADDLLSSARQFLGLRYLWGGTSGWGMDCSGLTHLTFRAQGTVIPRDAFDQAAYVEPVALDEVQPGDLYFFARPGQRVYHVGLVSRPLAEDGSRWMLHAPESGELIENAPLAPHREQTLVSAGRVPGTLAVR